MSVTVRQRSKRPSKAKTATRKGAEPGHSSWPSDWILALILIAVTLAVYAQIVGHPFINYDDGGYVVENQHVKAGLTWQTFVWSLTSIEQANWHPLTWLSHALDCQLFGLNAGRHHLTSLLIHIVNVVLLFILLKRVTGERVLSFLVAALFAVHPFNVESVAWVAERKNVLSTFFFLATLAGYGWYARLPNWKRYLAVAALFAGGLAAKPMLVTLPAVLLLLDYWPLQRWEKMPVSASFSVPQTSAVRLLFEKIPLLLLSIASAMITLIAQKAGGALPVFPLSVRIETALLGYALYLVKAFWPSSFSIYYPDPFNPFYNMHPNQADYLLVVVGALFLVSGSSLAWRYRRERPYFIVGWLWYVGTLVPVIGIVKAGDQAIADRYAYVPLIGVFVSVVWALSEWVPKHKIGPRRLLAAATVVLATLSVLSFIQVRYWRGAFDLFLHALNVTQDNFIANDKIGNLLYKQSNPECFRYYEEAARIDPIDPLSHEAMAGLADEQGRYEDARKAYDVVIRYSKDPQVLGLAYANLGAIYSRQGHYDQGRAFNQEAMRLAPADVENEVNGLQKVYAQNPTTQGYIKLTLLLDNAGRPGQALEACKRAAKIDPSSVEVQKILDHLERELASGSSVEPTRSGAP